MKKIQYLRHLQENTNRLLLHYYLKFTTSIVEDPTELHPQMQQCSPPTSLFNSLLFNSANLMVLVLTFQYFSWLQYFIVFVKLAIRILCYK